MGKKREPRPQCSYVLTFSDREIPCTRAAYFDDLCEVHTPKRGAVLGQKILAGVIIVGVWAVILGIAAAAIYGLAALGREQEAEKCQPLVATYEQERQRAEAIRIPLILGSEILPGDENLTQQDIMDAYSSKRAQAGKAASVVVAHQGCFGSDVVSRALEIARLPKTAAAVSMPAATTCADGWLSSSIGTQGACSHHGGVSWGSPYATLFFVDLAYESSLPPVLHLMPAA
ncbi:hypothetical protein [Streptomyces hyaluromycini]|uniref:hypothetical protein n=1 Tax=Streptomyces hyaluromycini TaxID=1377993 RepID=UPI0011AE6E4D|nr:hypothetical protein [Streptomyces hyaluromycini]